MQEAVQAFLGVELLNAVAIPLISGLSASELSKRTLDYTFEVAIPLISGLSARKPKEETVKIIKNKEVAIPLISGLSARNVYKKHHYKYSKVAIPLISGLSASFKIYWNAMYLEISESQYP